MKIVEQFHGNLKTSHFATNLFEYPSKKFFKKPLDKEYLPE